VTVVRSAATVPGVESTLRHGESKADLIAVADLHWESRRSAYRDVLPQSDLEQDSIRMRAHWADRFQAEQRTHRLLLAETADGLAGFSYFGPDTDPPAGGPPDLAMLNALHVRPAAIGAGIGRLLMTRTLEIMIAGGARAARLWVLADNVRAREFYRKGGWAPDGMTREQSMYGVPTRQLRYAKRLRSAA
jgi:ribosomal protein S18 acetylase RimI-like enzyme